MAGIFNSGKAVELPAPVKLAVNPVAQTAALRPVQQSQGGNARALADALGSLNGGLQRYAEVDHAIRENPESLANKEWIAQAQLMSADDLRKEVETNGPNMPRVQRDAAGVLLGEKATTDARAALTHHFNTDFDYANGDAAADADRIISGFAAALPDDISRAAFTRSMRSFRQAHLDRAVEAKATQAKTEIATAVIDSFRNTIDEAQSQGKSAEQVAALVFERSAGNRTYLGLTGQEQNDTIIGIAEEAAQRGDRALVIALLDGTRQGADGKPVPPLSRIAGNATVSAKLKDLARARQTERIEQDSYVTFETLNTQVSEGTFTEKEAAPLIANGTLTAKAAAAKVAQAADVRARLEAAAAKAEREVQFAQVYERQRAQVLTEAAHELETYAGVTNIQDVQIISKTGNGTVTITKKETIDAAIARKEAAFRDKRQMLINGGASEADADIIVNRDRVTFYAANALDNEAWKMQFNGIAAMVSPDALAKGEAGSQQAQHTAELFLQVRAANPAYAEGLLTNPQSKDFLQAYEVGRNVTRLGPAEAAIAASAWQAQPEAEKNRYRLKPEKLDKMATDAIKEAVGGWSPDTRGANFGLVRGKYEELSRLNLPEEVLQSRVAEWLDETAVPINGVLLQTPVNQGPDFPVLAEKRLKAIYEDKKDELFLDGSGDDDLYLVPTASGGTFTVWSKTRRVPIGVSITPADIESDRKQLRDERAAVAVQIAKESAAERRQTYNDYVARERALIDHWRNKRGRLGKWSADGWEKSLDRFIFEHSPEGRARAAQVQKSIPGAVEAIIGTGAANSPMMGEE